MDSTTYPERPAHFDRTFLRALVERHAANTIGTDGCMLLVAVVLQEDAQRYCGPVDYWNGQLMAVLGVDSEDTLARVRKRCVEAGWLFYQPGSRSRAARYWVNVPIRTPRELPQDCGSSDPTPADLRPVTRSERGTSLPDPNPKDIPAGAGRAPGRNGKPKKEKKPRPRRPLFDAIAEVTGSAPKASGSYIAKVEKALASEDPPFTPDEVLEFGRRFWELCSWAAKDNRERPELGELEKNIGKVRTAKKTTATEDRPKGHVEFGRQPPAQPLPRKE